METLNIILTNSCNASVMPSYDKTKVCKFCYRSDYCIKTDNTTIDKLIFKISENRKIKELSVSGGDPLTSPHFNYFIDKASSAGLDIYVHTNGILLEKNLNSFKSKIKGIALPLDGSRAEIADHYRGKGFFDLTVKNFNLVKDSGFDLVVHTFLSKYNFNDLESIADLISIYHPRYWLISSFNKVNGAKDIVEQDYEVLEEYKIKINSLKESYPDLKIIYAVFDNVNSFERLFLQADGEILVDFYPKNEFVSLGSLLDNDLSYFVSEMRKIKGLA